jgi:ABC-type uncharacterized transport system permease subunit
MTDQSQQLLTAAAYAFTATLIGLWFYRTQSTGGRWHWLVALVFGVLWPISLLWRAAVRTALKLMPRRDMAQQKQQKRTRLTGFAR